MRISGLDTAGMLDLDQVAARARGTDEADRAVRRGAHGCSRGSAEIGAGVRHDLLQHGMHACRIELGSDRRVLDRFAPTTFVRSLTAIAVVTGGACMVKIVDPEGLRFGVPRQ